jgi:hypothetical protein
MKPSGVTKTNKTITNARTNLLFGLYGLDQHFRTRGIREVVAKGSEVQQFAYSLALRRSRVLANFPTSLRGQAYQGLMRVRGFHSDAPYLLVGTRKADLGSVVPRHHLQRCPVRSRGCAFAARV